MRDLPFSHSEASGIGAVPVTECLGDARSQSHKWHPIVDCTTDIHVSGSLPISLAAILTPIMWMLISGPSLPLIVANLLACATCLGLAWTSAAIVVKPGPAVLHLTALLDARRGAGPLDRGGTL